MQKITGANLSPVVVKNVLQEIPIPFIEEISHDGLIRVLWNLNMIKPSNLSTLTSNNSVNQSVPLELRILAGSID